MLSITTPRLLGEVLGTALLVFFGAGTLLGSGQAVFTAAAMLLAAVAVYWIFGGHFNPWITLALAIRGTLRWSAAVVIMLAQLAGGILGGLLLWAVFGTQGVGLGLGTTHVPDHATNGGTLYGAILAETLAVFLLACVVFAIGDSDRLGIGMGVVYAAGTLAIFVVTAASMNLARTFGPEVVLTVAQLIDGTTVDWDTVGRIWVYVVSGALGAALAGLLYPMWRPDPLPETEAAE